MDKFYRDMFFREFRERFLKDLKYLDSETFYKVLWAFVKSKSIVIHEEGAEWKIIKEAV